VKVNNPQRKVVLLPLKSLLYHNSSDLSRTVPVSTGEKESGECVSAPATFKFLEKYFWALGKMQPELKRQTQASTNKTSVLFATREESFMPKFKWVNIQESIRNIADYD